MRFAVLSDTHYISASTLYENGKNNPRDLLRSEINKQVFADLAKREDLNTILITGDLTDAGDVDSHMEYIELLREVKRAGKNVYVLTATHDFHFSRARVGVYGQPVQYKDRPWETPWCDLENTDFKSLVKDEFSHLSAEECAPLTKRVAFPDELWEMYREFGRDQAFSSCDSAYSYAVKLEEKIWCLMLNNNMRDVDAMKDASPSYSPACYRWIAGIVRDAHREGAFVFACTHHPLTPPVPAYKLGGTPRNMRNPYAVHTLADIGIPLVFSGHTHFSTVSFGSSDRGNVLCNVTTPSICFLPPAWRLVDLEPRQRRLRLHNVEPAKTEKMPVDEDTLREHYVKQFVGDQRRKIAALPHGLGDVVLNARVKHLYPLCKKASGLTQEEYGRIRDRKLFDIIMDATVNMQTGDGKYTPDTPEYKFMMGLCAVLDSMIASQPFIPLEKKLQGYTITQIVEPMLYKKGVPDGDADFFFDRIPEEDGAPAFTSHAGSALMAILSAAAVLLSPFSPIAASLALPVMTLRKKKKLRKNPPRPERY